jgi:HEPN domain-containing protein
MRIDPAEVREWLEKAGSDLISARILLAHDPPVPETAAFHCQQTAEKALKGYLTWGATAFGRFHDLDYLLSPCEAQDPRSVGIRPEVVALNPFAVEIRYPATTLVVSVSDAQDALAAAEATYRLVLSLLPAECHPGGAPTTP